MSAVVAQHPNPDVLPSNIVQEMVRKTIQIAAPKSAPIKVKESRILGSFPDPNVKLGIKVIPKPKRNAIILPENHIQISLNLPVKSSFHGTEAPQPARRT